MKKFICPYCYKDLGDESNNYCSKCGECHGEWVEDETEGHMKNKLMMIITILTVFFLDACTTTKYVVKDVDTKMEVKGSIDGKQVGLNDKNEIIIQSVTDIVSELKGTEFRIYAIEEKVNYLHSELRQCFLEKADSRLRGNGAYQLLPTVDGLRAANEVKESIGRDQSDNLVVVKREYYLSRLNLTRQYEKVIRDVLTTELEMNETCQFDLSQARVKAGLPAHKLEGKGHFDLQGNWLVDVTMEHSLDDAFKGAAR